MPNYNVNLGKSLRKSSVIMTVHHMSAVFTLMLATLLTTTGLAIADTDFSYARSHSNSHYSYPIDFALTLSNSDIDLREDKQHYPVALERINFSIFSLEEKNIQFGFNTGSSYLSLDNDIALAGMSLNGYHAGLAIRAQYGSNPKLGFHADYRYQETRNETASQSATLSWHEWTMAASGKIIIGQRLGLMLGWAYSEIKARRRARGDINDTASMRLDSAPQTQLELEWLTGTGGRVSIALQNGAYENIAFTFAQTFK